MSKQKTASISLRVDEDLKIEFMQYCEQKGITFSKWLRNQMIKELESNDDE
jgi:antitoxin component of RelBE/YafQ-DinJ toxin-antitoxin module